MNATEILTKRAIDFAKAYVAVTEALLREGVPEDVARDEARAAAMDAVMFDHFEGGGSCL